MAEIHRIDITESHTADPHELHAGMTWTHRPDGILQANADAAGVTPANYMLHAMALTADGLAVTPEAVRAKAARRSGHFAGLALDTRERLFGEGALPYEEQFRRQMATPEGRRLGATLPLDEEIRRWTAELDERMHAANLPYKLELADRLPDLVAAHG